MRLLIRCVVLCLVVSSAAVPAGARTRSTDPAGGTAALKAQANQAAARYAAAQSVYAELGDRIAALEGQVSDLEGRMGPLRQRITRQAVAVYQADVAVGAITTFDGPLAFSADFGTPRPGGRRHIGNDLLNPRGTSNVAVVDGTIETRPWAGGGITIFLAGDDGNSYVYMHLMQIVGAVPRRVAQGEVIGLVGRTGDAQGYHTHFEFHPGGGDAVSPYPLLAPVC